MRIGLIDIEPKVFNTAYMQIAGYHRGRGDTVDWWNPVTEPVLGRLFDHVYCSSLFDFTDKSVVPQRVICGGTGFDVTSRCSQVIEESDLDYSIYSVCDTSYVWFSRGCIRNCPFCIIQEKEGKLRSVKTKNLNPNGKYITVMDNNFFANPVWQEAILQLEQWGEPVDFEQGIDCRIWTEEVAAALGKLKMHGKLHVAWDDPNEDLLDQIKQIAMWSDQHNGNPANPSVMCYALIGFNSTHDENMYRVESLRNIRVDPFVMKYDPTDEYQSRFARWVNFKPTFRTIPWKEYQNKGDGGIVVNG